MHTIISYSTVAACESRAHWSIRCTYAYLLKKAYCSTLNNVSTPIVYVSYTQIYSTEDRGLSVECRYRTHHRWAKRIKVWQIRLKWSKYTVRFVRYVRSRGYACVSGCLAGTWYGIILYKLGLCTAVTSLRGVPFGDFWAVNLPKRLKTVKIYNKLIKRSQTDIKHQEKFKTVLKRTIGNEIDRGSKISRVKSQIWLGVSGSRLNFTVNPVDLYRTNWMFNRKQRYFTAIFCRKVSKSELLL